MNWKKTCALFTALFMMASAFSACAGNNQTTVGGNNPLPPLQESSGIIGGAGDTSSAFAKADNGSLSFNSAIPVSELSFTDRELDGSYDTASATRISLADNSSSVSGRGATVSGNTITISAAGTYLISGTLSSGQLLVNASNTDKIQLVLQGADITCPDSAAICVMQADKVFLTVAPGTENKVSCGETFSAAAQAAEITAAIFSKDDLAINGSGTLIVNSKAQHGIVSKDDLSVADASLIVTAASDGLRGRDCVRIASGNFDITAGSDGIQSNNDTDPALGYVYISGGTFSVIADHDGIQAETLLCITGGTFDIQTGGGSKNANSSLGSSWEDFFRGDRHDRDTPQSTSSATTSSDSFKGLKAGTSLVINGGALTIDSADDTIHCDADIAVRGCTLDLASGDDGIHAEQLLSISGGSITVSKSYEGLEATTLQILGGDLSITASDDGLNASDGSGGGFGGMKGRGFGGFGSNLDPTNVPLLLIAGGRLYVNASGDGLDSNGPLTVTGGEIYVDGPTNSGNGAIDSGDGYEATINGGTLVAAGASGMAEGLGNGSAQCSMLVNFGTGVAGNTELTVTDSAGKLILSYTPTKAYQSAAISSPLLKIGETYTITAGSTTVQIQMSSVSAGSQSGFGGMMGGGFGGGFGGSGNGSGGGNRGDRNPPSFDGGTFPQRPDSSQDIPQDIPQWPSDGSFPNGDTFPGGSFPGGNSNPGGLFPDGGSKPGGGSFPNGNRPSGIPI